MSDRLISHLRYILSKSTYQNPFLLQVCRKLNLNQAKHETFPDRRRERKDYLLRKLKFPSIKLKQAGGRIDVIMSELHMAHSLPALVMKY